MYVCMFVCVYVWHISVHRAHANTHAHTRASACRERTDMHEIQALMSCHPCFSGDLSFKADDIIRVTDEGMMQGDDDALL